MSAVFNGTSKTFQNELLDCLLEMCRDEMRVEIKQSEFLSVMSGVTQQVVVFRCELSGIVRERVWRFSNPK